ncbi:hypothetical protein CH256_08815 [Rhodococcus sp. 05-2254-6]|uniref:TetR/AcrR family transcriptional regulator n=1 Tax=Rhodococcus sp. 05-2254-6 TaxID=2022489 RepID=UPI000B9A73A5|nr:TetR/AcrR family transcriptional regulator [Rhodococcus sp. 05-2254-6]OZE35984.1 hypothetical protein CH256_08815 [Rhodococcus sp. 05-2254-6]
MTERRVQLYEAAAELFTRHGFRKTSIEDITRSAGVSKGAFYLEFRDKKELFEALVRREIRRYLAQAAEQIIADPEGGRLSRIYHHCIEVFLRCEFLCALYTQQERVLAGLLSEHGPQRYRPRVLLGAEFVGRLQRAGLIRHDTAPETLSHTLSLLMVGPLLAEPVLHTDDSPTLAETFAVLSSIITTAFEVPGSDTAEGKRAFATLAREMTALLDEDDH